MEVVHQMFDPMLPMDDVGFSTSTNDCNGGWSVAQHCWDRFEAIGSSPLASDQWLSDLQYNPSSCGNDYTCTLTYSPGKFVK